VPQPQLGIASVGPASIQITWATNFADYVLEYAESLPTSSWSVVTNTASTLGDHLAITTDPDAPQRFYRLRKP